MNNDVFLLGLELGISTVKAGLFTLEGEMVGLESHEYLIILEGDKVEVDPERYCLLPWNQTGGLAFKWFKDRFAEGLAVPTELGARACAMYSPEMRQTFRRAATVW